jgi:hypothetical protein
MLAGGQMRRCFRVGVACCLILLLGACAKTTAFEPQNQLLDARQARLHFIRQPTILSALGSAEISVDGKPIGSLAEGAYILADRPPGPHTISVYGPAHTIDFSTDIQVEPGASYYFELGPVIRLNVDLFKLDSMGVTGRAMTGRFNAGSYFMFYCFGLKRRRRVRDQVERKET